MSQEIKIEKLIDVIMRELEVHGFLAERMVQQLSLLYQLGWSIGFDQGLDQCEQLNIAASTESNKTDK